MTASHISLFSSRNIVCAGYWVDSTKINVSNGQGKCHKWKWMPKWVWCMFSSEKLGKHKNEAGSVYQLWKDQNSWGWTGVFSFVCRRWFNAVNVRTTRWLVRSSCSSIDDSYLFEMFFINKYFLSNHLPQPSACKTAGYVLFMFALIISVYFIKIV